MCGLLWPNEPSRNERASEAPYEPLKEPRCEVGGERGPLALDEVAKPIGIEVGWAPPLAPPGPCGFEEDGRANEGEPDIKWLGAGGWRPPLPPPPLVAVERLIGRGLGPGRAGGLWSMALGGGEEREGGGCGLEAGDDYGNRGEGGRRRGQPRMAASGDAGASSRARGSMSRVDTLR